MDIKIKQPESKIKPAQGTYVPDEVSVSLLRFLKVGIIAFLVIGSCMVILLQVMEWMRNSPVFALKKIRIENNYTLSRQEIVSLFTIPEKPHLLELPLEIYRQEVAAHPWVRSASLSREYPSTLVVHVEERQPAALVLGKANLYVDGEGYILPQPKSIRVFDVPCIANAGDIGGVPGERTTNADIVDALALLEQFRQVDSKFWFNISEISWEKGESFVVHLYNIGIPIRIPKGGDPKDRLYVLDYFLKYLRDEDKLNDITLIDLSYAGQLIVRSKEKKQDKK